MIKLLIVEDERRIREGIKNTIDWKSNGIIVCGEAENGKEALLLIEELSPKIVLLDIRMPGINGLQVIETLNKNNAIIKVIILSGYDDFSYAQKALKLGAFDYLVKPCDPDEMLNAVLKAKSEVENENNKKNIETELKIQLNESIPLLKEKYLLKLVKGEILNFTNLEITFELYRILISPINLAAIILDIDDYKAVSENNAVEDMELIRFSVKNITSEIFSRKFKTEVFDDKNYIVILINIEMAEYENSLLDLLELLKINIKKYLNLTFSIGIGMPYSSVESLHRSYIEAQESINTKFFIGNDTIIKYEDINEYDSKNIAYPLEEEREIINCIKTGNIPELNIKLDNFFSVLQIKNQSKDFIIQSGLTLTLSLYHLCLEKNIQKERVFDTGLDFFDMVIKLDTLEQLKSKLLQYSSAILEQLKIKISGNKTVMLATAYIDANYNKDISLEIVAKEIYISPSYLSLLFKQNQGINFVDYIHKLRIEHACEILKHSGIKVNEVATRVGYKEERYFYQVFKRVTGMTPSQYKASL